MAKIFFKIDDFSQEHGIIKNLNLSEFLKLNRNVKSVFAKDYKSEKLEFISFSDLLSNSKNLEITPFQNYLETITPLQSDENEEVKSLGKELLQYWKIDIPDEEVKETISLLSAIRGVSSIQEGGINTLLTVSGRSQNNVHQPNLSDIEIDLAIEKELSGENIRIAILDSGLNKEHICLANNTIQGFNFIANSPDFVDNEGHGTASTGIIGAQPTGALAYSGIAPNSELLIAKVFEGYLEDNDDSIVNAILWSAENGANIINNSWERSEGEIIDPMKVAIKTASAKGSICVFAAGNDGLDADENFPIYMNETISVGAHDSSGELLLRTNFGENIDVYAPGHTMEYLSAVHNNSLSSSFEGLTSMATANVTGAIALMLENEQVSLTIDEIRERLRCENPGLNILKLSSFL